MPRPDVPQRPLLLAAFALLATVVAVVAAVLLMLRLWHLPSGGPSQGAGREPASIEPGLETAPQPDRAAFMRDKAQWLTGHGWVDRQRGIARIPLTEAMALIAAGKLSPSGAPGASAPPAPTGSPAP